MSDLISRSEVLELLYKIFNKYRMSTDKNTSIGKSFGTDVFEEIRNMPTSYSVDKVVDELEKESFTTTDTVCGGIFKAIRLSGAIEIVKQGGVSDDVCEWKKSEDYPFDWIVGCDGCEVNHRQGDYCPRCGKKIKAVE